MAKGAARGLTWVLLARLAGFEPATRCLEGTASVTRTVRDVGFHGLMTRYRSGQAGAVATRRGYTRLQRPGLDLPVGSQTTYPLAVGGDVWVGAITTLVGAALGGAISFVLSRQQLNDARLQRKEAEVAEQRKRSEDRRFQAYAEFLTRARSYRNAVETYYLHSDIGPSIDDLDVLLQAANVASALVFLVVENEDTHRGCRAVLQALWYVRTIIRGTAPDSFEDPWIEINVELGRATRQFQNAAREELGVSGPTHPWDLSDVGSSAPDHST